MGHGTGTPNGAVEDGCTPHEHQPSLTSHPPPGVAWWRPAHETSPPHTPRLPLFLAPLPPPPVGLAAEQLPALPRRPGQARRLRRPGRPQGAAAGAVRGGPPGSEALRRRGRADVRSRPRGEEGGSGEEQCFIVILSAQSTRAEPHSSACPVKEDSRACPVKDLMCPVKDNLAKAFRRIRVSCVVTTGRNRLSAESMAGT